MLSARGVLFEIVWGMIFHLLSGSRTDAGQGAPCATLETCRASFLPVYRFRTRKLSEGAGDFSKGTPLRQMGVAPNGIELHPVLAMCFGRGCALPSPPAPR